MLLDIFNSLKQRVKTLVNQIVPPGAYSVSWDGTRQLPGRPVSSGIYIYRLTIPAFQSQKKMIRMQ